MAVSKFGRIFKLSAQTKDGEIIDIESPFTIEFTVKRQNLARTNEASFVIYNLNEDTRAKLFKDPFNIKDRRVIQFCAGYELRAKDGATSRLIPQVFLGEVRQAFSSRQGSDVRTEFECYDGGIDMATAFTSRPYQPGADTVEMVKKLVADMPGLSNVTIGEFVKKIATRGGALMGNPMELLKEITGGRFYIDSQKGFALDAYEVLAGKLLEINSESGLLETPRRSDTFLEVPMLFEPRLEPSMLVRLNSRTAKNYNGIYKVVGIQHRGVISGARGGNCTTTISLFAGDGKPFRPVVEGMK